MASMPDEYVLNLKNNVYISTLTDLKTERMLKMDVKPGRYKLIPFYDGYVFIEENYDPKIKDIVKIFWNRDEDKGLSGTYWDGKSEDPNQLRLFNKHIRHHLESELWESIFDENIADIDTEEKEEMVSEYLESVSYAEHSFRMIEGPRLPVPDIDLIKIPDYHNLPVIFFLTKPAGSWDNVDMEIAGHLNNDIIVWKVKEVADHIGFAVQSHNLVNMLGDQAGIGVLSGARAFGNFEYYNMDDPEFKKHKAFFMDSWVFQPGYKYMCEFKPCYCDVNYYEHEKTGRRRDLDRLWAKQMAEHSQKM